MLIAGVDEAGRGPLAGPVVAAAVILNEEIEGVMDSKRLSPQKREILADSIQASALAYSYGICSVTEIDSKNIHWASLIAMQRAIESLNVRPDLVLVDGKHCPTIDIEARAIVKGDVSELCISAASILAKVKRDHILIRLDEKYPEYGFKVHKGYPTKKHLEALMRIGPCEQHRRSYRPVQEALKVDLNQL